jgi:starch-binding outer membrane protein, SusD/RagB family
MKNLINRILVMSLVATMMVSCGEDALDLAPLSSIGENGFYKNETEVEAGVVAIYDGLQRVPLREFAVLEMRSDNGRSNSREGNWGQFESFRVLPTNTIVWYYWSANYNTIFRANKVLEVLDVVADPVKKAQFEGEAKFARALCHFNLVRAFGDVPVLDRVIIQTDKDYLSKDPMSEVYALIQKDLEEAVAKLPARGAITDGRATSGAAKGILAKMHLTLGNHDAAKTILDELVVDGAYGLEVNYADVFFKERGKEILFAIQYNADAGSLDPTDRDTNGDSQDFSFEMTKGGQASGLNYKTADFTSKMDPLDVVRNPLYTTATLPTGHIDAIGKYLTSSANVRQCGNDWIVLRFADVLLMHSEAILKGQDETRDVAAIKSYNAVRARVGLSTLPEDGSVALTKQALLKERRYELAFENHRLHDLIRFGEAEAVLGAYATATGTLFEKTDLLLPIPQIEVNVSFGALKQNPGYN